MKKFISKFYRLMARIYDLPNAFRVIDIMDEIGCDIEKVAESGCDGRVWEIKPKWYVTEEEAKDLQTIILCGRQYKRRNPLWMRLIFRNFRDGCRPLQTWF